MDLKAGAAPHLIPLLDVSAEKERADAPAGAPKSESETDGATKAGPRPEASDKMIPRDKPRQSFRIRVAPAPKGAGAKPQRSERSKGGRGKGKAQPQPRRGPLPKGRGKQRK